MTEATVNQEVNENSAEEELKSLKQRAKVLGISHSPNIGVEALDAKIKEHMAALEEHNTTTDEGVSAKLLKARERKAAQNKAKRLIRVRITNMNPVKKAHEGEIFTVSNNLVGTIRRMVPFGVAWHVESMLLNVIKERQMQVHVKKRNKANGQEYTETKLVPEFSVEVLPPLSEKEIKDLSRRQQMADGTSDIE